MRPRTASALLALLLVFTLTHAVGASAAPRSISGKLSKRGYTVIALAANGKAKSVVAKRGKFRLRPPAKKVTLQLRAARGTYAGPIVVGTRQNGKRAVVGVAGGARLGEVKVKPGSGYAKSDLPKKWVDRRHAARANRGVPIGAGRLGRVRSSAKGAAGGGRDQDRDGLPGAFDVDDDGDLVLDNVERSTGAKRQAAARTPGADVGVRWSLSASIDDSFNADASILPGVGGYPVNVNAAGAFADTRLFGELRDIAMRYRGALTFSLPPADQVELDCASLSYCVSWGSGELGFWGQSGNMRFPACCDPDQDGFGTMFTNEGPSQFVLAPGAPEDAIGAGDAYVEHLVSSGASSEETLMLNSVLGGVPAVRSYSSGGSKAEVSYPMSYGSPGNPMDLGSPGTFYNPIVLTGATDAIVTFEIWRPQRRAIPGSGEGSDWVDMGGLLYTVDTASTGSGAAGGELCPGNALSEDSSQLAEEDGGVRDLRLDAPADPQNTLEFSVNLSECLRAAGRDWLAGEKLRVFIVASSEAGDRASGGGFYFRQG